MFFEKFNDAPKNNSKILGDEHFLDQIRKFHSESYFKDFRIFLFENFIAHPENTDSGDRSVSSFFQFGKCRGAKMLLRTEKVTIRQFVM